MKNEPEVKYRQQKEVPLPAGAGGGAYPETKVKTTGTKIRGTGAAERGVMARGPMG